MIRLGRVCRAYGLTPSHYRKDHSPEDLAFDFMVFEHTLASTMEDASEAVAAMLQQVPGRPSAEDVQGMAIQWLAKTSYR